MSRSKRPATPIPGASGPFFRMPICCSLISSTATASGTAPEPAHLVLVTYFTSNQRCPTCLKIEKQAREAIESGFSSELASGLVRFQTVNFDLPENGHLARDYELTFKTVVVSDRRNGKERKWEKFDKVWDLVGDPPALGLVEFTRRGAEHRFGQLGL